MRGATWYAEGMPRSATTASSRWGRLLLLGALVFALDASRPCTAEASVLGILSKAAKAARAAKGAAKAGAAAKGAGKLGAAAKTGALLTAGGAAFAAERSGLLFGKVADEAGTAMAYLGREASGEFRLVTRSGAQSVHAADDLPTALKGVPTQETDTLRVYVDLNAAAKPEALPAPAAGETRFVLDAEGAPHPLRAVERPGGGTDYVVDAAEGTVDLASFVADQTSSEAESTDALEASSSGGSWWVGFLMAGGLVAYWVLKRRRRVARVQ